MTSDDNLTDQDRGDLTAHYIWTNLPADVRKDIAANFTPEQKAEVGQGILNARRILGK